MKNSKTQNPFITINFEADGTGKLEFLDYRDNGPGIDKDHIKSEVIFDPDFSLKPGSKSGLGMAIAGESAARNDLQFKAYEAVTGAYFRLQPEPVKIEEEL